MLIRALGFGEDNVPGFLDAFLCVTSISSRGSGEKDQDLAPTQEEALIEIYKRARPGEPATPESSRNYFQNAFFESRRYDLSRVGRYKLNRKLGPEVQHLPEVFPMLEGHVDVPDADLSVLSRWSCSQPPPIC